ncbi:MAG: porin family protein [Bacteroidetes bacterium]|jgi:hypothetical protein|nr:porin family protein [Bacteroidota bacterium]MDP4665352.1 PorT family protein [Flavobacteriaceae bacterium]
MIRSLKLFSVVLIVLATSQNADAQIFSKERIQNNATMDMKKVSWGYFLGFNNFDFNIDYKKDLPDIETERSMGFNVGLIGNVRINDYIDIRLEPGLTVSKRTLQYDSLYFLPETMPTKADLTREIPSTYIYVPLLVKLSTKRINNFKPFVVGGVSTALNLSSNEKNVNDNSQGDWRAKKNVLFYELGFGIDFYLYWFKFTPTIRGVFGLTDEVTPDVDPDSPWTGNISKMESRGVFINFTFQ